MVKSYLEGYSYAILETTAMPDINRKYITRQ